MSFSEWIWLAAMVLPMLGSAILIACWSWRQGREEKREREYWEHIGETCSPEVFQGLVEIDMEFRKRNKSLLEKLLGG
jgi:hypothetical protein